jgi:hypothetical protein
MIRFWPRRPRFPVIIDLGSEFIGANTAEECSKRLARAKIAHGEVSREVIDARAEGFGFYSEMMVITPMTIKKMWKKTEIVGLYNSRRKAGTAEYPSNSLGNKPVQRVVSEIVYLLKQH